MSILDWSFVILLSGTLLFSLFGCLLFIGFLRTSRKWKRLKRKQPPKKKKKRRQFLRACKQLEKKRKGQRRRSLIVLVFAGLFLASGMYSRYYQQNHLQAEDADALVQSYYLLDDAALQITNIQNGDNPKKSSNNLHEITSQLASYGARKANLTLTEDGQKLLNRHFTLLRELGVNLNGQSAESLQQVGKAEEYLADIVKVQESQSTVFKRFNVNEGALKKKQ
ncbi:hypothetical protein IW492_11760 [Enterococcus sp. BWB1-3]|uniref:hypothetical protein n=1 Tax=Enterococcus sp. BWB1-3 TaxID=2787713 RepID=UPI0019206162|nr:hypothetical protein [Enterococcus sp. BWB1-3]MBL1229908.1 hypothetical protein [Enterococcus sp. BWB1-3]